VTPRRRRATACWVSSDVEAWGRLRRRAHSDGRTAGAEAPVWACGAGPAVHRAVQAGGARLGAYKERARRQGARRRRCPGARSGSRASGSRSRSSVRSSDRPSPPKRRRSRGAPRRRRHRRCGRGPCATRWSGRSSAARQRRRPTRPRRRCGRAFRSSPRWQWWSSPASVRQRGCCQAQRRPRRRSQFSKARRPGRRREHRVGLRIARDRAAFVRCNRRLRGGERAGRVGHLRSRDPRFVRSDDQRRGAILAHRTRFTATPGSTRRCQAHGGRDTVVEVGLVTSERMRKWSETGCACEVSGR
jgi:hypothetical protein